MTFFKISRALRLFVAVHEIPIVRYANRVEQDGPRDGLPSGEPVGGELSVALQDACPNPSLP